MKKTKILQAGIILLLVTNSFLSMGQIILTPNPKATVKWSDGIAVICSSVQGSFYLNDYLLTDLKGNDTVYIINLQPGEYTAKVVFKGGSTTRSFNAWGREVTLLKPGIDSLQIKNDAFYFDDIKEKVTGRKVLFLHLCYFNITQTAFYSAPFGSSSEFDVRKWFRTFTTINGFQIAPGFSAGIGISYNNYDVPAVYNGRSLYSDQEMPQEVAILKNVSFLPVFIDARTHLSGRRIAPFIKLDIGYNFLLSKKSMSVYEYRYVTDKVHTISMVGGGFYFSPGIGLRIAVSKLIQIIASMEYSYEKSKRTLTSASLAYPVETSALNYFKFNIGIGFQKR
ncbi:MAG: hypothetical protein WCJ26_03905 [bacterium]